MTLDPRAPSLLLRSTDGCASLPNPRPRNHSLEWVGLASGAWTPQSWALTGPLTAGPGVNCSRVVLNCSAAAQAERLAKSDGRPLVVFLDPTRPLSAPAVQCGEPEGASGGGGGLDMLVVYSGPRCPLWRPDNAFGCFWCGASRT